MQGWSTARADDGGDCREERRGHLRRRWHGGTELQRMAMEDLAVCIDEKEKGGGVVERRKERRELGQFSNNPSMFSIRFRYGGVFTKFPGRKYIKGKMKYIDDIDSDLFSVHDMDEMMELLDCVEPGDGPSEEALVF
ncbi:unnamed protein product [Lactuca saligna]|uniref:PB1-like domain-containing protein n=1 Tax=Lactuca saligna TaxID=75948 RepID=A0AA35ZX47_LACSI|nr:unnamed protein product [Lactuca saligna]